MKYLNLVTVLFLFGGSASAQEAKRSSAGPSFYFNSFQYYTHTCKDSAISVDSAIYFVRKLAEDPRYSGSLRDLLHASFAQFFIKHDENYFDNPIERADYLERMTRSGVILGKMISDSNQRLVKTAQPIFFWTSAQKSEMNHQQLATITKEFMNAELGVADIHQNSVGRYALLIHNIIYGKKELTGLDSELFQVVFRKLKEGQIRVDTDTASRSMLDKRGWYRYMYAYCNFMKANQFMKQGKTSEAGNYFRSAYEYSPDLADRNNKSSYFYDMIFLMGEENDAFIDGYLNYLVNNGTDKKQTLATLLNIAQINPFYKTQLQSFYTANIKNEESFNNYWINAINRNLKAAPAFSLKQMNGKTFTKDGNKGKWILLDFWGTWCGPCRKEHPDMQKFSQEIETIYRDKISLLTIACMDKQEAVLSYMQNNKYNFPVAMSDTKIEKIYPVNGYPTKILISPQGKYLIVPFGTDDWIDFVKKYCDL